MSEPKQQILGYYQPIFAWLHKAYHDRLVSQLDRRLDFRRKNFLSQLPNAKTLYGDEAWRLCSDYLTLVEAELAKILVRHSVFFWVHLYRRIGVYLASGLGPKTDANTLGLVRQIAELAISKYGDLNRTDDACRASQAKAKDVLGGHYQRLLTRWNKQGFLSLFRELQSSDQFVLTRFELRDFFDIYYVEALAYEYWRTTALMRAIGKTTGFSYEHGDWITNHGPPGFGALFDSYDERIGRQQLNSVLAGTWFRKRPSADGRGMASIPYYNIGQIDGRQELAPFGIEVKESFTPNFLLSAIDFGTFHSTNSFMAKPFADTYQCSFDAYVEALWGVCNVVTECAHILFAQTTKGERIDANSRDAWKFFSLIQRGYGIYGNDDALLAEVIVRAAETSSLPFAGSSTAEVIRALDHLKLTPSNREKIGLWSSGRRFPLISFGDSQLIDLQGIPQLLHTLFVGVQHKQLKRGTVFEEAFSKALESEGYDVPRIGVIVALNGSEREIDASVRVGSTLVLFECRSIERPLDYEIGNLKTFRKRKEFLEEKIDQVLSLADFVRANPKGRNYDLSWAREIVPFVVSPFVEWVWERSDRLWHDQSTPRILQADEAFTFLSELRRAAAASNDLSRA